MKITQRKGSLKCVDGGGNDEGELRLRRMTESCGDEEWMLNRLIEREKVDIISKRRMKWSWQNVKVIVVVMQEYRWC